MQTQTDQVIEPDVKVEKAYKQSPEKRAYFRQKATERRIRTQRICTCGEPATIKLLDSKRKLCDKCDILRIREKYKKTEKST